MHFRTAQEILSQSQILKMASAGKVKKQRSTPSVPCEVFFACTLCGFRSRTVPQLYTHYRATHKGELSTKHKAREDEDVKEKASSSPSSSPSGSVASPVSDENSLSRACNRGKKRKASSDLSKDQQDRSPIEDRQDKSHRADGKAALPLSSRESSGSEERLAKSPKTSLKTEETSPKTVGTSPKTDGTSPKTDGTSPKTDGTSPKTDGTSPKTDGTSPKTDGTSPRTDEASPKTDGTSPKTDKASPKTDGTSPKTDGTSPRTDGTSPKTDGTSPKSDGTSPKTDGTSPRTNGTSPRRDGTSPKTDSNSPKTEWTDRVTRKRNVPLGMLKGKKNSLMVIFQHADQTKPLPEGSAFKLRNTGGEQTYLVVANVDVDIIESVHRRPAAKIR